VKQGSQKKGLTVGNFRNRSNRSVRSGFPASLFSSRDVSYSYSDYDFHSFNETSIFFSFVCFEVQITKDGWMFSLSGRKPILFGTSLRQLHLPESKPWSSKGMALSHLILLQILWSQSLGI